MIQYPKYQTFGDTTLVAVEGSGNKKLGKPKGMTSINLYVIPTHPPAHEDPSDIYMRYYERACCAAECPHTKDNRGDCYVSAYSALGVARRFWSGDSSEDTITLKPQYVVRATAHGDLAQLAPQGKLAVLELLLNSQHHTAYSAGWRRPDMQVFRSLVMASVRGYTEAEEARSLGWHTYRQYDPQQPRTSEEIQCLVKGDGHPSEKGRQCLDGCRTPCNGSRNVVSPDYDRIAKLREIWDQRISYASSTSN